MLSEETIKQRAQELFPSDPYGGSTYHYAIIEQEKWIAGAEWASEQYRELYESVTAYMTSKRKSVAEDLKMQDKIKKALDNLNKQSI